MTFGDQVTMAFSNLGRRKVRTVLTSMGVIVGILTIVVMVSLAWGVRRQVNQQFASIGLDRVVVRPPGSGQQPMMDSFGLGTRTKIITDKDVQQWRGRQGVTDAIPEVDLPWYVNAGLAWKGKTVSVTVASPTMLRPFQMDADPTALAGSLDLPVRGGIVLNRQIANALVPAEQSKSLLNQSVEIVLRTSRGESRRFPLKITGVSSQEFRAVQVSPEDRIAMKGWWVNNPKVVQSEGYDSVTLRTDSVRAAKSLTFRIKREGFQVQSVQGILDFANRVLTIITVMLSLVGGIALLVASIGIANTMIMAIYERTREIGTLKAMGASRGEIRRIFMLEAGMIGLLGGTCGLVGGWLLGKALNQGILWYMQRQKMEIHGDFFVVTPTLALGVLAVATLIGMLAGFYPAQRAARLDPLEALRHE